MLNYFSKIFEDFDQKNDQYLYSNFYREIMDLIEVNNLQILFKEYKDLILMLKDDYVQSNLSQALGKFNESNLVGFDRFHNQLVF